MPFHRTSLHGKSFTDIVFRLWNSLRNSLGGKSFTDIPFRVWNSLSLGSIDNLKRGVWHQWNSISGRGSLRWVRFRGVMGEWPVEWMWEYMFRWNCKIRVVYFSVFYQKNEFMLKVLKFLICFIIIVFIVLNVYVPLIYQFILIYNNEVKCK